MSNREDIRDARGNLIGSIIKETSYRSVARNTRGSLLGSFNPNNNQTRDSKGTLTTIGNTLSRFFKR